MSLSFSIGLIPNVKELEGVDYYSKVAIITKVGDFYYSAYVSGSNIVFKSLNPEVNRPTLFTYSSDDNGIRLLSSTGYLSSDGSTITPLGQTPQSLKLFADGYNLPPNELYAGIYYKSSTGALNTRYANLVSTPNPPFGGEAEGFTTNLETTYYFIPVVTTQVDNYEAFPTPYLRNEGLCKSPTESTIFTLLSAWMRGEGGCNPEISEGCLFTTKVLCDNNIVFSYCTDDNTCGFCVGQCPPEELGTCQYDGSGSQPYFSCSEEIINPNDPNNESNLSFSEKYPYWTALIIVICVVVFFWLVIYFANSLSSNSSSTASQNY